MKLKVIKGGKILNPQCAEGTFYKHDGGYKGISMIQKYMCATVLFLFYKC